MLELEYIPLKTPDGGICGHARVRGGFVELSLRTPMRASARCPWCTKGAAAPKTWSLPCMSARRAGELAP